MGYRTATIVLTITICGALTNNFNANASSPQEDKATYCKNQRCDSHAIHVTKQREYPTGCRCKPGWAGNGKICGPDKDLDGWPDEALNCYEPKCAQDNCPNVPNSGQEDLDFDGIGDACDIDIDNDGIPNTYNPHKLNSDRILFIGDNGIGNCCHKDIHTTNDGFPRIDNCPFHSNPDQRDFDSDGVGDICDNCRRKQNPDQYDMDFDGIGDACDGDIDNDGVINTEDNCPFLYNPNQETDYFCIGDQYDENALMAHNCPNNSYIYPADFSKPETVFLNPNNYSKAVLRKNNDGAEVIQVSNKDPTLLVAPHIFSSVHFEGTFFVEENNKDNCIGFAFSYQNNRQFYLVTWKGNSQTRPSQSQNGIQIKLINSKTGPGSSLGNALCPTGSIPNQAKTIWKDNKVSWSEKKSYRWILEHKPCNGLIRLKIFEKDNLITESGNIYDNTLLGGRLGLLSLSHGKVIWSDLIFSCNVLESDTADREESGENDAVSQNSYKCPNNSLTRQANFNEFEKVFLGPAVGKQGRPVWVIRNSGSEVVQTANSDPGLLVGKESFSSVDYEGTFYVNTDFDDDPFGLVFSYKTDRLFYAILWKQAPECYKNSGFAWAAQPGLHIKLVNSTTGPGVALSDALWHTGDISHQTKNLWWDENGVGWKDWKVYRWSLSHRPAIGLIRVKIFQGTDLIIDSGNVYDYTLHGGKLGVFSYSQNKVSWSKVTYKCNEDVSDEIWKDLPLSKRKILEPVVCDI